MEPADSNHAHAASPLHESLLEGPLSSPLHEFLSEDDEDVKPSTPATVRENASKLVIAAACLAFVATTVALAVRFPVKKHKFARTSCVSHADLAALEISAVFVAAPLAVEYECDQQRVLCGQSRVLSVRAASREHCSGPGCLELLAHPGAPLDLAADDRPDLGSALDAAVAAMHDVDCSPWGCENFTETAAEACVAVAACEGVEQFWASPRAFCANTTAQTARTCVTTKALLLDLEERVLAKCANSTLGPVRDSCAVLNRSLAQRGYYQTHCFVTVLGRTRERPECILFNDTLRVALDEACANIPHGEEVCSAARALAWRWGHTADAFPLVDALRDVASVLCAEGVCSDAAELTRLDRWRQGGLAAEVEVLASALPAVCEAWPRTRAACANASAAVAAFCDTSQRTSLECQWAYELRHFKAHQAEQLFVATWRAAEQACASKTTLRADGLASRRRRDTALGALFANLHLPRAQQLASRHTTNFAPPGAPDPADAERACELIDALDREAQHCPAELPLISEAAASSLSS